MSALREDAQPSPALRSLAAATAGDQFPVQDPSHDADAGDSTEHPAPPAFATEQEAFHAILSEVALILGTADAVLTAFQQGLAHPLAVIQRPAKQIIVMRNPPKPSLVGIVLPGQSIAALKLAYGFLATSAQEKAGGGMVSDQPPEVAL